MKAPLPPDEAARLKALREYEVLDTPPEPDFDDIANLAAQICAVPVALITLVDEGRQWFKSRRGIEDRETSREVAFCAHAILEPARILEVPDATLDRRFADNPHVQGDAGIRFYAGAPLVTPDGLALGTLCVVDHVPRELNAGQRQALATLSRHVMVQLELRRRNRERTRLAHELGERVKELRALHGAASLLDRKDLPVATVLTEVAALLVPSMQHSGVTAARAEFGGEVGATRDFRPTAWRLESRFAAADGRVGRLEVVYLEERPVAAEGPFLAEERALLDSLAEMLRSYFERQAADSALRDAQRRQRLILDSVGEGIMGLDRAGKIIFMNPAGSRMLGRDPGGMLGCDLHALVHHHRPDGRRYPAEECPFLRTLRDGELRHAEDEFFFRADGTGFPVEYVASPVRDEAGAINGGVICFRDITIRRRAEEQSREGMALLRMASRLGRLGAWQLDVAAGRLEWSEEVRAIHEVGPEFVPSVESGIDFYAPECQPAIREAVGSCLREGRPFDLELTLVTARGRRIWVRAIGEAVRGSDGQVAQVRGAFQDIGERKQAEQESRRLADQLVTTLESITDAFFTLDREWRFIFLNREAERLLARRREDLLGRSVWSEFPEAVGSAFEREFRRAVADSITVSLEEYYAPLQAWFSVRAYPTAEGLAVYFQDVTELRAAREGLRASEERFRLLARATLDAVWDWDLVADKVWWNEGFESLFGYRREEVEASSRSWTDFIHPEDLRRVMDGVHAVIDGRGTEWSDEYRFRRKDGVYVHVADRGEVIRDVNGRPVRMIGGMTDQTERREADRRLREQAELLDKSRDAILVRDLEHRVTYWNRSAERLYGWSAEEVRGKSLRTLLHFESSDFDRAMESLFADGEWTGELVQQDKAGRQIQIEGRWTLLRDDAGNPVSVLAINTDITERKKLELQFLRNQRMESIGTLAGGIAHDLNNLLAPITMGVELLRRNEADPRSRLVIDNIERSAKRGSNLVKQVLSFARGIEGSRVPLQIRHVVREIESIVENTFPKNIVFEADLPRDVWLIVGDPTQVSQVLLNLCLNARDALADGGRLTVRAANIEVDEQYAVMNRGIAAGRYVVIEVIDNGCGIPREIIDRVFEPFFTTKEHGKGTGLGLSTVLGIVRSHGGCVNVYSEPGKGSTFKVYFPAQPDAAPIVTATPFEDKFPRGEGELVLVVDDEASIRQVTQQTLEAFGYRVLVAEDGAEAVGIYATHRQEVALVLTDMMMPVMDGPALIAALRRINPQVRIIAASGLNANGNVARAANAGVKHFLPKPYSADTMLGLIRNILTGRASRSPF